MIQVSTDKLDDGEYLCTVSTDDEMLSQECGIDLQLLLTRATNLVTTYLATH